MTTENRETIDGLGNAEYESPNRERLDSSEIAGERLYQQALETRKKIEKAREELTIIEPPKLELISQKSGRFSRDSSPCSSRFSGRYSRESSPCSPRYIQLYESAKLKNRATPSEDENSFADSLLSSEVLPNERCDHLFSLALPKQIKGKERREEIEKSKIKPPPPYLSLGKISPEDGSKVYDRGMHRIIKREMKLMEAAIKSGVEYKSPLLSSE